MKPLKTLVEKEKNHMTSLICEIKKRNGTNELTKRKHAHRLGK